MFLYVYNLGFATWRSTTWTSATCGCPWRPWRPQMSEDDRVNNALINELIATVNESIATVNAHLVCINGYYMAITLPCNGHYQHVSLPSHIQHVSLPSSLKPIIH